MNAIGHQLTYFSLWAMPIAWLAMSWFAGSRGLTAGAICFAAAGITGLLSCFFDLPTHVDEGLWRVSTFVPWEDAPIGHVLTVYLPVVSKVSLVVAVALVLRAAGNRG
jgi:hypothetical protein